MKLELKHITHYLPYGLNGVADFLPDTIFIVDGILLQREIIKGFIKEGNNVPMGCSFKEFKPILRPLSDYEKFEQIVAEMTCYEMGMIDENANHSKMISYLTVELMFKYHIDVFNLIPQGLAIDINTLNKEL
jgi:hypothetical protein